jgi:sugar phosphate isomerase/epimerase
VRQSIPVGVCTSPEAVPALASGYDHVELSAAGVLAGADATDGAVDLAALRALCPPVRAFNCFVPGDIRLVGPDVSPEQVAAYAATTIARAAGADAELIVFGSGGSRRVPEGFARSKAWDQLVWFLRMCADYAGEHGLLIAIEPLNASECNILNSYREGVEMAREVARPDAIKVLADTWHMAVEEEPLEAILEAPEWLAHVHLADSPGRGHPGSGSFPFGRLFAILHEIGYAGRASIECRWPDDLTAASAEALAFLEPLATR